MLASGFSHELNTPLATTLTCVEGILREAGSSAGGHAIDRAHIENNAALAREQVLRARGITQHFLRLSRGQAAAADLVNVRQTVGAVARLIEPTARAHGVKLVLVPGADVLIRADEAELQHILINLTLNAIQASPQGGEVTLAVEGSEPARVHVIDHGCGIAPENQKRIFEPFFSLRQGGTGLGLFLSLNFARHWGGDITLTSTPGGGSTFDVVLPANPAAADVTLAHHA
jgi:signal transduction histidine kinase